MDGIALYFHVYFTRSHIPFGFSTDPWSLATDWKQTKLFFDDFLIVRSGSIYYGGLEFHSTKSINDFRNMILNLELLKGDPTATEEEIQMTWNFKMHADNLESEVKRPNNNNVGNKKSSSTNTKEFNSFTVERTSKKIKDKDLTLNENCVTDFSLLNINCDNDVKIPHKNKITKNFNKKKKNIANSTISIENKNCPHKSTVHLNSKKVNKNKGDNCDIKEYISRTNNSSQSLSTTITIEQYNYSCRTLKRNKIKLSRRE